MRSTIPSKDFWKGKRVFITGHTGFKGAWLCLLLDHLGAEVFGYALDPPTNPSLFELCNLKDVVHSSIGDIRDAGKLQKAFRDADPDIVIHMAAQPIVRASYMEPVYTYEVNIMGTVNLLEAIRQTGQTRAVVNVTTDKCYENKEWLWPYRENEPMGGYDPYSSSKACSEIVSAAYRTSFFNPAEYPKHRVGVATARAGNVIGGGDWAADRLIPDFVRAIMKGEKIIIRSPEAIRPWQFVLEPLTGYLLLAERLFSDGPTFAEAWNFGPNDTDARPVRWIVDTLCSKWGSGAAWETDKRSQPHEATYLKLDCSKAKARLNWHPHWDLETTLEAIIRFMKACQGQENIKEVCKGQIAEFLKTELNNC